APITCITYSSDHKLIASGGQDDVVRIWDLDTGKAVAALTGHDWHVLSVTFSPDGKLMASGGRDNTARIWDIASGKELLRLSHKETRPSYRGDSHISALAFSPDGKRLASADGSRVALWDTSSGKLLKTLEVDHALSLAFSPDGLMLAIGGNP